MTTLSLPLLLGAWVEHLASRGRLGAGVEAGGLAPLLAVSGCLLTCVVFWTWVWVRWRPRLHEEFHAAGERLGGDELGDVARHRLRRLLDRVLPHGGSGSVLRAFRAQVSGRDLFVAEWFVDHGRATDALGGVELVVVVPRAAASLPTFHLQPEGPLVRFSEWLYCLQVPASMRWISEDVDFGRDVDWSRRWFLCGPDRRALRAFFRRRMRDVFRRLRGWRVSGRERWLVLRFAGVTSPAALPDRVREAVRVADRVGRAATTA